MTTIVRKRKESEKAKKEATVDCCNEKKNSTGQKNTKTGLKMIGLVSSFHFSVQGFNSKFVCCSPNKKLHEEHFVQTMTHPDKDVLRLLFYQRTWIACTG